MSPLTGAQKASLIDALLSGYTSDEQLAELLDLHLDARLAEITEDGPLRERVFGVVTWAEAHGRTRDLALQAQKYRPRNAKLAAFVDALYPGERTPPPDSASSASRARDTDSFESRSRAPMLIYGAVAVAAVVIAVALIALSPWSGPATGGNSGGNSGNGGNSGETTKDRPVRVRITELTGLVSERRIVIYARFSAPRLARGSLLWFVVGSGPRCRDRTHREKVDNPALGYTTTSILRSVRTRPTCGQLFVEDSNGQAIAMSEPRDITFSSQ